MLENSQKIANKLLEKTPYKIYTVGEINEGFHRMGEFDSDFEEDPNLLIFCVDENNSEIEVEIWHPGFMVRIAGDFIESVSIIPPGPVYKSTSIDEAIRSMIEYMEELGVPES